MHWSVFLALLAFGLAESSNECPSQCACLDAYVDCGRRGFLEAPEMPSWMETLELSGNRLGENAAKLIGNATELRELKLNKNRLRRIPHFTGLTHLTALSVSHNRIEVLEVEALEKLPKLQHLDISRNLLTVLPKNIFPPNCRIRSLNLNYNVIEKIHGHALDNLRHLTEIKMNGNKLTSIEYETFANLASLRRLQMADNQLETIPGLTFRNQAHLRHLRLRNNRIHTLNDGAFHGCVNLETLELDGNGISVISKGWLFNLTSLTQLSLSGNRISDIKFDAWEFVGHLENLELSGNRLIGLTMNTLGGLSDLKTLGLRDNKLSSIEEGAFEATPKLTSLDLSGNEISWTIEDMNEPFGSLTHLWNLRLASNRIKSVSENAFLGLTQLRSLDLNHNNITTIHDRALVPLMQLNELVLNTTSLFCDCNLQWLRIWISEHPNVLSGRTICNFPLWLRLKRMEELQPTNFTCSDSPKPQILQQPHSLMAHMGSNITFECRATSTAILPMEFQWKKDNVELSMNIYRRDETMENQIGEHENATIATSRLFLFNVSHEHMGRYQCVVSNSYGVTYSARSRITVGILPVFRKVPSNVTVATGATVRLDCAASGEPKPQMAWQKDGGNDFPAARERRMHVMPTDDAFFIINAKTSDQGVYTCTAENDAGIVKVNATLTVLEPPSFVKPMENKEVKLGTASVLECLASGSPKPQLEWTKDGAAILSTERHFFAAEGQLLIIVGTQLTDAGSYECEIRNELGVTTGGARLTVQVPSGKGLAAASVNDIVGIVVITIVLCAVGTSIVWVAIIYKAKTSYSRSIMRTCGRTICHGRTRRCPKACCEYSCESTSSYARRT
uniref:Putative membrane glycoprotein lig-1 n=1 Tax=Lutzomyia longipalpis TaxID=7200 RepID=A0A1B0CD26_LUTLO